MKTTIVIPNYNGAHFLEKCMPALLSQSRQDFSILFVDNASKDDSEKQIRYWMEQDPERIFLIQNTENTGFATAVNQGILWAKGQGASYALLLNNDTEVAPDFVEQLLLFMEEKEKKGKGKVIFQKIKEKIKYMDRNDIILIIIPFLLLYLLYPYARTNKKAVDIKVQNQILSKEQLNKNVEVSMNETSKLNESNFEVFVSKKVPNRGIIPLKSTDFINNNNKIILYKAIRNVRISGNPEILKKLRVSVTGQAKINFSLEAINIELDPNQKNNSILFLELNSALLDKEQIFENKAIVTVAYEESYVE